MRDLGDTVMDVLLLPGRLLLQYFPETGAAIASSLHVDPAADPRGYTIMVSVVAWLALALAASLLAMFFRNALRVGGALVRTFGYRLREGLRDLRTYVVCRMRKVLPRGDVHRISPVPEISLTAVDEAVLRAAQELGSGFTVSAPELAERLRLRPAQIQRSLDKLRQNRMIDPVIGSTDGFDNYRLTDSGTFVASRWHQNQPHHPRA